MGYFNLSFIISGIIGGVVVWAVSVFRELYLFYRDRRRVYLFLSKQVNKRSARAVAISTGLPVKRVLEVAFRDRRIEKDLCDPHELLRLKY